MLHREVVTIAQVRVPDGTNEITQAETLLDAAGIPEGESALVTLDAAHTQRETAEYIGGKPGWDYLMTVKGNQPSLQREVFDKILPLLPEPPHHVTEEHSRGRIKRWSCWITGAEGIDFQDARQAAFIRREIFEISGDRISKEHALILTGRKPGKMTAADVNKHAAATGESRTRAIMSAIPYTGKTTARLGPETARRPWLPSATSHSGYSA